MHSHNHGYTLWGNIHTPPHSHPQNLDAYTQAKVKALLTDFEKQVEERMKDLTRQVDVLRGELSSKEAPQQP